MCQNVVIINILLTLYKVFIIADSFMMKIMPHVFCSSLKSIKVILIENHPSTKFCMMIYCRVSYVRGELIFAYFAVPYMREIKVPRKNKPKTLFRT